MPAITTWNVRNMTATQFDFWLIFDKDGPMKLTRTSPKLSRTERAIFLEAVLPNALWETPSLKGKIEVADPGQAAMTFDIATTAEAVKKAVGLDIEIQVVPAEIPERE